ncbi:hypothetical protein KQI38_03065 [Tissierella carlieri]|jgi:hypothetical protein|uniref:Chorion class high-cysteine HCB protein 13 n=1 Tax=Tissierella carlieri TaxID=689904 RepID=A0ABT1S544_9FIRM|nr:MULTISPECIES: hypothetical protein [Tissierella]MBU5310992.1 hypothetical protein [Tissierella carlieri]MCQ4921588.1 hypothetical protein [Tissierella carlieri]MDU5083354.1 hypothetical protein [Bacillota bacterium]
MIDNEIRTNCFDEECGCGMDTSLLFFFLLLVILFCNCDGFFGRRC